MRNNRTFVISFLIAVSLFSSRCEKDHYGCTDPKALNYDVSADIDDNSCEYRPVCRADGDGNLIISNQTGYELWLYRDYSGLNGQDAYVTCIPADAENFLIDISNRDLEVCLLQIWIAEEVIDRDNPSLLNVYRQWSVALSNTNLPEERANWLITGNDNYAGSGTLLLSYPDFDEFGLQVIYQVDIFLNNRNGAKLASLRPGILGKKVSVDFGVQYLYYHYWYSDPNSQSGNITEIGWAEDAKEVVINEYHKKADIEIPVFYSTVGKVGEITIVNESDFTVNVYANDHLIEDIAMVDGSTHGLSSIPANDRSTFIIPVEKYNIVTRSLGGDQINEFSGISVVQTEKVILYSGLPHRGLRINNATEETLALYNQDEEYLGLVIEPGKQSDLFRVSEAFDTLVLIDFAKTKTRIFPYASVVDIADLEDYVYNRIVFTLPWPEAEGLYQSPEIPDNDTAVMKATLINREPAVLTFEYNVSSEPTYDIFSFSADETVEINNASGETGWVIFSKAFDAGTHTLRWVYKKDHSRASGRDNVQIRQIQVE
ncbi:MAG: hypothetical protein PVF73_10070 [Bacteroidales bacterium]|jgi:hypothetical protein